MAKSPKNHDGASRPEEGVDLAKPQVKRAADGRFRGCGNPNGRPRKEKAKPQDVLLAVLDEEVPLPDGSGRSMPVLEAIARQLCVHASKNPNIGLKLLEIAARASAAAPGVTNDESEVSDDAVLAGFLARQERRRKHKSGREGSLDRDGSGAPQHEGGMVNEEEGDD